MALGVCELLWLKITLEDLKIKWDGPMRLHRDSKSTINIAHNPVQYDRTKHIEGQILHSRESGQWFNLYTLRVH